MVKKVPIGIEFYKRMIDNDYYYIDKTLLIKEILDGGASVSLFTRPRRFGKTLALSMLKAFFEDERDETGNRIDNSHYFEGKNIAACGEKYLAKQEKYPVINLTLKSAKQPSYEMAYHVLRDSIIGEFSRHRYVCEEGILQAEDIQKFHDILARKANTADYATSLAFLSQCLKKYHGSNVVILIDEYDVPLENSYFRGFYDQMVDFIRSLFESALKTNNALEFAVVTGCLRISKESIFTGLNNLDVVSILRNDYAEAFGFTPAEVRAMLAAYGMADRTEEVREWYDGYLFGNTAVYNPWNIISYVNENRHKTEFFPKPYWSNTSSNSIIRELVEEADIDTRSEIEHLIEGGAIEKQIHEDITYDDIHMSKDNLWNFLFFTGYLKKAGEEFRNIETYLQLTIPNKEIRYVYKNTVLSWFDQKVTAMDRSALFHAVETSDCEAFSSFITQQLLDSISFFDYAESYYHGFLLGLLKGSAKYQTLSNRESGNGRPDIVMRSPSVRGKAFIFELKVAKSFEQMEQECKNALEQAARENYRAELEQIGYSDITVYGVCFYRKECMVMR